MMIRRRSNKSVYISIYNHVHRGRSIGDNFPPQSGTTPSGRPWISSMRCHVWVAPVLWSFATPLSSVCQTFCILEGPTHGKVALQKLKFMPKQCKVVQISAFTRFLFYWFGIRFGRSLWPPGHLFGDLGSLWSSLGYNFEGKVLPHLTKTSTNHWTGIPRDDEACKKVALGHQKSSKMQPRAV